MRMMCMLKACCVIILLSCFSLSLGLWMTKRSDQDICVPADICLSKHMNFFVFLIIYRLFHLRFLRLVNTQ